MALKASIVDRDHGWKDLFRAVEAARGERYAKVGVLGDTEKGGMHEVGPDGKASPLTVAEIAGVLEFGTENGHIPERSFLRSTFDARREELFKASREFLGAVLFGKMKVEQALNALGSMLATEVKRTITSGSGVPPPNAMSTALNKAMKGRQRGRFVAKDAKSLGDAFSQIGVTAAADQALGYHANRYGGRKALKAASSLGAAFAQIGALAAVRPLVDTGRMVGAITWALVTGRGEE